jgi:hypothetical protein
MVWNSVSERILELVLNFTESYRYRVIVFSSIFKMEVAAILDLEPSEVKITYGFWKFDPGFLLVVNCKFSSI